MTQLTRAQLAAYSAKIRTSLFEWAKFALAPMQQAPAEHHRIIIEALEELVNTDLDRLIICLPPGSAKALALDTPIPTPDGWKRMGDLKVGDRVFGDDGIPCKVTWVSPIWRDRPVYKVTTDCGDEIIADRDHEWRVSLCRKPYQKVGESAPSIRFNIHETHELAKKRSKRPMIERAKPLVLPEIDLPIDPWLLGVWLGDGDSSNGAVTSSVEDQPWMREKIESHGYMTRDRSVATKFGVTDIRKHLVTLNVLNNKHIPEIYLRASEQQRLALLQGLIDTDGTACKKRGCATFCSTNIRLAEGCRELVRSLGIKAGWSVGRSVLNGVDHGPCYKVSFYHEDAARMPRKAERCKNAHRTTNTYIDVEYAGIADTVCIEVDSPTHLFLCGKSMTPTHNSTYASVLFPAWYMATNPYHNVIGVSCSASLAENFSRMTRNVINDNEAILGAGIVRGSNSVEAWLMNNGSTYKCMGAEGQITGLRADLLILDDLVKGRDDADSPARREKLYNSYRANILTRLKPNGKIVLILTRWHEDDIAGRLIADAGIKPDGEWKVISLPAICVDPSTDLLQRQIGEPLWPNWQSLEQLERLRTALGEREFSCLFQQNPVPQDGLLIKVLELQKNIEHVEPAYGATNIVRAWDIAATSEFTRRNPDWTVGVKMVRTEDGRYHILDVKKMRGEPNAVERFIMETAEKDGKGVTISLPQDPGAGSKSWNQHMTRMLMGYDVHTSAETGSKISRATPFISQVNGGNVYIIKAEWNREYMDELETFPSGLKDDQLDASSRAFNFLVAKARRPIHFARFNYGRGF